jgi:hypothetical protein
MDWTTFVILSFVSLVIYTVIDNSKNRTIDPWQCQRCMRHNNTRIKCELCDAPFNWKLGDKVKEDGD